MSLHFSPHNFQLIETLLFRSQARAEAVGYFLLNGHLRRLERSRQELGFALPKVTIEESLRVFANTANGERMKSGDWRVRLLLSSDGEVRIESAPLVSEIADSRPKSVVISPLRTCSRDELLYHKTTARALYENEFARVSVNTKHVDVLFMNEHDEFTEGSRTNLFVEIDRRFYTPPVSCGLLPGVMREHLLETWGSRAKERILFLDDLLVADRIFVANSVRGLMEVSLERGAGLSETRS